MEVKLNLDEAVQRLEKEIDDVTITSPSRAAGGRSAVAIGGVESMRVDSFHDYDVLPEAAEHMGSGTGYNEQRYNNGTVWFVTVYDHDSTDFLSEAMIRFLKAKLRVMQEEMDRLCQECSEKVVTCRQ